MPEGVENSLEKPEASQSAMIVDEEQWSDGRNSPNVHSPANHPNLAWDPSFLWETMFGMYEVTGDLDRLSAAISNAEQAVSATPQDHPDLASWLDSLGNMLLCRYEETGNMNDFDAAISNAKQAVSVTPENHPDLGIWLNNLASMLLRQYQQTGNVDSLDAAISNAKQAEPTSTTPEDYPDRAIWLNNFGGMLFRRYEQTGNMDDLKAAISNMEQAVSITPEDDPALAGLLSNLGTALSSRFEETGNLSDLEAAISSAKEAVSTTPKNHSNLRDRLNNLGIKLLRRYERTGNMDDLESAITNTKQAISITPESHPDLSTWQNNLGNMLLRRFEQTENMDDLESAILNTEQAISITPKSYPDLSMWQNNFGNMLLRRYQRTGDIDNLEAALSNIKQAIYTTPEGHPNQAKWLNSLGVALLSQYEHTENIGDLEAAITTMKQAVTMTPEEYPDLVRMLSNLGDMLFRQYKRTEDMDDLAAALSSAKKAVSDTPEDNPNRAIWLSSLGDKRFCKYEQTGNVDDLNDALSHFEEATKCSTAIPLVRVHAARKAIGILQTFPMWERACELAQDAVKLLPSVCGRYLDRRDQQHAVLQTVGLASDACSLSLRTGRVNQALQQVEFGRGLILGYLIDSRSDVSILRKDHPDLANEFEQLRFSVSRPIDAVEPIVRDQAINERREAIRLLEDCLDRIRRHDGHQRFLLEPTLDELLQCATEGPIIIVNVTSISSDAIIVSSSGIKAINLPEITPSKASFPAGTLGMSRSTNGYREKHDRDLQIKTNVTTQYSVEFLSWLWRVCVRPILTELEVTVSTKPPRMWWIGTGVAASYPFHAAGCYSDGSLEDTLSLTVPSYTPTIKSLTYARSCAERSSGDKHKRGSVLVVAMPETPGQNPLSGVPEESAAVKQALGDVFKVEYLEQPSAEQVMDRMRESDIVHFACHGSSDRANPSDSHLLLQRSTPAGPSMDKLTVQAISERQTLGKARIAYLSACSTAEVKAGQFADEALHIVSAFQVAGFGHVIGSLWSADDKTCARVARLFYEYLIREGRRNVTNRDVAEALRYATQTVRRDQDPLIWAPYIHAGA
ncbi:TPR domain containing protein [Colletotrichum tofieldiae]|uniref:TPR domain containing protein n=1 Tax=Colletotrichum tofieldiae TaxID=708197 RepID=A0A166VV25_9PEZI|nr:TPR domain containing protein [Colletotrichum tofieldiae]GKT66816.1 TPR domain containing protein [Colletotrichum tofieldiae]GKT94932.1 TPR domain containing protein [Colletotrichum tofieldiae]